MTILEYRERPAPTADTRRGPASPSNAQTLAKHSVITGAATAGRLGVVERGALAWVRGDEERWVALHVYGSGSVIGAPGLLGLPEHALDDTLETLAPTRIRWFTDVHPTDATLAALVLALLAARTRYQHNSICRRQRQTTPQQVATTLLTLQLYAGLGPDELAQVSLQDLATTIGINRSVVSAGMGRLIRSGWVRRTDPPSLILDHEALRRFAGTAEWSAHSRVAERLRRAEESLATYLGLSAAAAGG